MEISECNLKTKYNKIVQHESQIALESNQKKKKTAKAKRKSKKWHDWPLNTLKTLNTRKQKKNKKQFLYQRKTHTQSVIIAHNTKQLVQAKVRNTTLNTVD